MSAWKGEITLGQAASIGVTVLIIVVGSYLQINTRVALVEEQVKVIREEFNIYKADQQQINRSLIRIETKQDRVIQDIEELSNKTPHSK